ncbi:hypothetical protein QQF64_019493 [Cirrhinus molitorella]|uniref:HTH psq-type domain-containing protein n=1 Tax=Cirrhinus molitorella TaxID=172907 RepID=A0ABR3LJ77_9TELE
MPKIHPETKVLIIKRLKTRSTADVANTFNVSQRQVQRIKKKDLKRLEMFLTSPGQADPARQLLERTVCWLENPRPAHFPLQQSATRLGHLKSLCQPEQFVGFCLEMASMVESVPRSQH